MADTGRLSHLHMPVPLPAAYARPVRYDSSSDAVSSSDILDGKKTVPTQGISPTSPKTPLPLAYTRQLSYGISNAQKHDPNIYVREYDFSGSDNSLRAEYDYLEKNSETEGDKNTSKAKRKKSVLLFLRDARFYIRVIAVLIMIVSLSLILTAIISFAKAQKNGNSLSNVPKPAPITDHPCVVFSGVALMNLVFSISILCVSCMSSKFNQSNNAVSATFTIVSAVGFASAMGACHFLNKQTSLQNDLWKWSCGNHKKGITSDAIDFNLVCNVVSYGWKFGLAQAALELLTFLISVTTFVLLKYANFARYGRFGKIF